jgi:hypothetical protein
MRGQLCLWTLKYVNPKHAKVALFILSLAALAVAGGAPAAGGGQDPGWP